MRFGAGKTVALVCLGWTLAACSVEDFIPDYRPDPDAVSDTGAWDGYDDDITVPDDVVDRNDADPAVDVPRVDWGGEDATDGGDNADAVYEPLDVAPDVDRTIFDAPPLIDVVYPPTGTTAGGDFVLIEGDYFTFNTQVLIDGRAPAQVDIISRYEIAIVTPASDPGPVSIKLITDAGSASLDGAFTYVAPMAILQVTPASGPVRGGVPVEVQGSGLSEGVRFVFGAREATAVEIVSPELARMIAPPSAAPGAVDVVAVGTTLDEVAGGFTYLAEPRLRGLLPPIGARAGGEEVRIDAIGISETCSMVFDTTVVPVRRSSSGWFVATTPAGAPGSADVVLDCGSEGSSLLVDGFTWVDTSAPAIYGVSPATGFTSGGEVVSVYGTGFPADAVLRLGGRVVSVVERSGYRVDVLTPSNVPGTVAVRVGPDLELVDAFTYVQRPEFISISPDFGAAGGGYPVTVQGVALDGVTQLLIDDVSLRMLDRDADSITFEAPRSAPGQASLYASVGSVPFATGLTFTFSGVPRADRFFPGDAPIGGGTPLYVTGDGFGAGCTVYVDGVAAVTERRSTGLLIAQTPPHAAGSAAVEVRNCPETFVFSSPLRYFDPLVDSGGTSGGSIDGELYVSVFDSFAGTPIEGATVMVQVRDSSPYVAVTDATGQVNFVGDDLVGPQTITAFAPERSAESIVNTNARRVTLLLAPLPPPPCEPGDPSCIPPPPDPLSEIIGFLTGMDKVADPPPGAVPAAIIETTRQARGFFNPEPGANILYENGPFRITSRNGDQALVALCGYRFEASGQFVPLRMGVVRGIAQRPGSTFRTTVDCSIPLNQATTFKLTAAPPLVDTTLDPYAFPGTYRARVIYDFGGEGVFESLPIVESTSTIINLTSLPPLEGPLAGVRFDAIAGAYPRIGNFPSVESFLVNAASYGVFTLPEFVSLPVFTIPAADQTELTEGYVEWRLDARYAEPDFFFINASSANPDFPRWSLFVPGSTRSFNFADYPEFSEVFGELATPGGASGSLGLTIRAVDVVTFDFDDFSRSALRQRNWRAASTAFANFVFAAPPVEPPAEP
jgi:hypothetical protein